MSMKNRTIKGALRSLRHTGTAQGRPRVPSRLEGAVKNKGIKPKKKIPKQVKKTII